MQNAPRIDTGAAFNDFATFVNVLLERPQELVKFAAFKRTLKTSYERNQDPRLLRVANRHGTLPLSVWSGWLVRTRAFNTFILFLICANAILIGFETEVASVPTRENSRTLLFLSIADSTMLLCFAFEILIKWLDNFRLFWSDSWNVFDFTVTCSTALPPILQALAMANEGNVSPSQERFNTIVGHMRVVRIFRSLKVIVRIQSLRVIVGTVLDSIQSILMVCRLPFYVPPAPGLLVDSIGHLSNAPRLLVRTMQYAAHIEKSEKPGARLRCVGAGSAVQCAPSSL